MNDTACFQPSGDPSFDDAALSALVNATVAAISPSKRASTRLTLSAPPEFGGVPSTWEFADLSFNYGALPDPTILNGNTVQFDIAPGSRVGAPLVVTASDARDVAVVQLAVEHSTTLAADASQPLAPTLDYAVNPAGHLALTLHGSLRVGDQPLRLTRAVLPPLSLFTSHLSAAATAANLGRAGAAPTVVGEACDSGGSGSSRGDGNVGGAASSRQGMAVAASVSSAPLLALLNHTLHVSDNTYAEAILRSLNRTDRRTESGLAACHAALAAAGVRLEGSQHVDGSGLSRHNLIAPATFVSLLRTMTASPLRHTLPLAGRSGTLKHRFVGTAAEGRVLAKTGTMGGVSALSGYLLHEDAKLGEVTFSVVANNGLGAGGLLRPAQDAIVVAVANARSQSL